MALNTINTDAISFKKLSGKAHTQQNFAVTEESKKSNTQLSYTTIFAKLIDPLPITNGGLSTVGSTDGVVKHVKFDVEIIPDTQIAAGRSQGYNLKLQSSETVSGVLYPAGTILNDTIGKLQVVPSLYGTVKGDGSTEFDPILYQTNGSTVIGKFDPINWYIDTYAGTIFVQDPPAGYDVSAARPGVVEAFLFVGDYVSDILQPVSGQTGTTASNVGGGAGVFKEQTLNDLRFRSLLGGNGIAVTATTDNIIVSYTGATGGSANITASNGLTKVSDDIQLGGLLSGDTTINTGYFGFKIESTTDYNNSIEFASWGGLLMKTSTQYIMEANLFSPSQGVYFGVKDDSTGTDYVTELSLNSPGATPTTTNGKGVSIMAITPNSVDTGIETALTVGRSSGTFPYTMSPNFGVAIDFLVNMNETSQTSQLKYQLTDVTNNAEEGKYTFSVHKGGNVEDILDLTGTGLKYTADYSASYDARTLVDYGFITGVTAATQVTVGNGLSFGTEGRIELGGSGGSSFVSMSGTSFTLSNNNPAGTVLLMGSSDLEETGSFIYMHQIGAEQPQYKTAFRLAPTIARFIDNRDETKGLEYQDDYSAFFTPRSIPDVAWVTGYTSSGGTGSPTINMLGVSSSETIANNIDVVLCDSVGGAFTITLPVSPNPNRKIIIKDRTGNALSNNVTIDGNGKNIDGSSTALLNTNRGAIELIYSEEFDEYYIVSFTV